MLLESLIPLEAQLAQALTLQATRKATLDKFREHARHSTPDNELEERRQEAELKDADNDVLRLKLEISQVALSQQLARQEERDRDAIRDRKDAKSEAEIQNMRILEHNRKVLHRSYIAICISVAVALGSLLNFFIGHGHDDKSPPKSSAPGP